MNRGHGIARLSAVYLLLGDLNVSRLRVGYRFLLFRVTLIHCGTVCSRSVSPYYGRKQAAPNTRKMVGNYKTTYPIDIE